VERDPVRCYERRGCRKATVAAVAGSTRAGDGRDHAGHRVDATDYARVVVDDVHVAQAIHRDAVGAIELGARREAAVTGVSDHAGAGDRGDDAARRIDSLDHGIVFVGDVYDAVAIDRDRVRRYPGGAGAGVAADHRGRGVRRQRARVAAFRGAL